ncbi:MAG: O-antigen ligase family protein [Agriterribacter sp.]
MRARRIRKAATLFLGLYLLICFFFIEDTYGSSFSSPFILFHKVAGFSILTLISLIAGLVFFASARTQDMSGGIKKLILQICVVLFVAYAMTLVGQGSSMNEGSGLLELRAFLNFIVFLYLWSICMHSLAAIKKIISVIEILGIVSAILFSLLYLLPIELFSVDIYGKSIMFESSIIYLWCFTFNLFFCRVLIQKSNRIVPLLIAIFLLLCIYLTLRRGFILLILFSILSTLFLFFYKRNKIKFIALSVLGLLIWFLSGRLFGSRYDFLALLDPESEGYELAQSSNLGHTLDIFLGFNRILQHPFQGVGPGVALTTGVKSEDFIVSSVLHSQPLHFWLRLGILGFIFILVFYFKTIKFCWKAVKIEHIDFRCKYAAAAVLGFMTGHFISSFFAPPFYIFEKQLLIFSFLFVLAIAIKNKNRENKKPLSIEESSLHI